MSNIFQRLEDGPLATSDIYDKLAQINSQVLALKTATKNTSTTNNTTTVVTNIAGSSGQAAGPQYAYIPSLLAIPSNNPTTGAPYSQDGLLIEVSGRFYRYAGSPVFAWQVAGVTEATIADSEWLIGVAGTNTITGSTTTSYAALSAGFSVRLLPTNTNTGPVTVAINGLPAVAVTKTGSTALVAGDLVAGQVYLAVYDGTRFQVIGLFTLPESQLAAAEWATSVSGTNTIACSTASVYAALQAGFSIRIVPSNTNTGATTLNVNSIGAKAVTKYGSVALTGGELVAGQTYILMYDGTRFQLSDLPREVIFANSEWATGVSGTNTIVCSTVSQYTAVYAGFSIRIVPANSNTGPATLNVNGTGAVAVNQAGSALSGGELTVGVACILTYDGTVWQIIGNKAGSTGSVSSWVPALKFGGGSTGITYGAITGHYFQIGTLIVATFDFTLTSKGSGTGIAEIDGLPLSVSASEVTGGSVQYGVNMAGLTSSPTILPEVGLAKSSLWHWGAVGASAMSDANFTNTTRLIATVIYSA